MNYDAMKQILEEEVIFYTDKLNPNDVYVEFELPNEAVCFEPIKSRMFKAFLSVRYRELAEEYERPDCKSMLEVKEDDAIYHQENPVDIHKRVAGNMRGGIAYFLADPEWRTVLVSAKGWKIKRSKKLKFLKYATDEAQVEPVGGGDYLKLILPKLNMSPDDALLYAIFLVQGFSRSSSHFCAVISSRKGTGKSTLTKQSVALIDPSTTSCALQPSSEDNLKTLLANTYVASFDNTAALSTNASNILCAAITGSKEAKRKLYSNCDQVILNLHNLVIINGIDIVPYKSDLAERSLYFELQPIPAKQRKTDAEIWNAFYRDRPKIVGAIFDTLVKAMQILPMLTVSEKERMADAHLEMTAIAMALGIGQKEFQRILNANRQKLQDAYAANNPFVDFVLSYMQTCHNVNDAAAKVYRSMADSIVGDRSFFPKSPSALSRKLNEERDALLQAGYKFESDKTPQNNRLKITRVPQSQQTKDQKEAAMRRSKMLMDVSSED